MADDGFIDALADHLDGRAGSQPDGEVEQVPGTGPTGRAPDFDAVVAELRRESTWTGPPVDLRSSILAAVRAEKVNQEAVPEVPEVPEVRALPGVAPAVPGVPADAGSFSLHEVRARRSRRARVAWALTAAAAVAAAFAAGVLTANPAPMPSSPPGREFLASGTELAPGASADVTVAKGVAGFSIQLDLRNLPAAKPGEYYAAWLRGSKGTVSIGTFHARGVGTPFKLWSGVDPAEYPDLLVTRQPETELTVPSAEVVLRASLR